MKKIIVMAAFSLTVLAGPALAQCPSSLSAEQMIECITSENAGYSYSDDSSQDDTVSGLGVKDDSVANNQSSTPVVVAVHN